MMYYKLTFDSEYYAVEGDDKYFYWFHLERGEWIYTSEEEGDEDDRSPGAIWSEWCTKISGRLQEVCALEVLVICGSVPGYKTMAP